MQAFDSSRRQRPSGIYAWLIALTLINLYQTNSYEIRTSKEVIEDLSSEPMAQFLVQLTLPDIKTLKLDDKGDIDSALRSFSGDSQNNILKEIKKLKDQGHITYYQPYHISNTIAVTGNNEAYKALIDNNKHFEIVEIVSNRPTDFKPEEEFERSPVSWDGQSPHWSLGLVKATGISTEVRERAQHLLYANADTGVDFTHEALISNYLGNHNGHVDHNYSWWDAVKTSSNSSATNSAQDVCKGLSNMQYPCDDNKHGTHTMSSAVGGMNLGMAPTSRWMACRNMKRGLGSPESLLGCLQFFLAPTNLQGEYPRYDLRPHVVGNSYSCMISSGGCTNLATFGVAFRMLRSAGVFMVAAVGNYGSKGCSSITKIPAVDPNTFNVGATAFKKFERSSFSSLGPVGSRSNAIDVMAPGSKIIGAVPGAGSHNSYSMLSGTSTATPHVGGAAILIMAACPNLERKVDLVAKVLRDSSTALNSTLGCGKDTSQSIPNNEYGYGMINVEKAMEICKSMSFHP